MIDIEKRNQLLGFPGSIAAVECPGWEFYSSRVCWKGKCERKGNKPVFRVEVVCDDNPRIIESYARASCISK